MSPKKQAPQQDIDETANLKKRLAETEETLEAIRRYMVDAFVINSSDGEQVVTLTNAHYLYRTMVESMNEGAVTLIPDGTIFYSNPCFANMVRRTPENLIGLQFRDLILQEDQAAFDKMLEGSRLAGMRGEFRLLTPGEINVPVQLSVYELALDDATGTAILVTDISERVRAEEKIRALAAELTLVEQEERHRISQILHDDLQQRLFAIRAHLSLLRESNGNFSSEKETNINQIQDWLSEAITTTRNLSINLSPVVLRGDGLAEAVTWLASQMQEQHGLQIEVDISDNFTQTEEPMRVLLFQAVRELLFNVVKHARTQKVTVKLVLVDGSRRITVSDSGIGFDAEAIMKDPRSAHGLLIIKDRLELMGCTMHVWSKPGDGTHVTIEIPAEKSP